MVLPLGILPTVDGWWQKRQAGDTSRTGARLVDSDLPAVPPSLRTGSDSQAGADVLTVTDVVMRFGGVLALDKVSVSVPRGSITALIGPNGSGKTTLFNVIDGTYTPTSGDVLLEGRSVARSDRTKRAFRGIGRTYQLPRLFNSLTVLENVAAVSSGFSLRRLTRSAVSGEEAARATELLEFVGLAEYVDVKATDLSYGQKKLVELAQVLMLDPAVILLDEPAAGINPTLLRRLSDLIRALNESGRTFVIVEHDMQFVLALADTVTVLARGQVLASGEPGEISRDAKVLEAYLGDDFVLEPTTNGAPA
jgi:ABC-type branched-subunit amino acid transport system ATPase component